jgi:hypothetical protein
MSKHFLRTLAGRNPNGLNHWLDAHRGSPRIAWYPSAGDDYRDTLFFSERYRRLNPALLPEPAEPEIYIHTDYLAGAADYFTPFDGHVLITDAHRTTITVLHREVLPPLRLAFHPDLVDCHPSPELGKVSFMILGIQSHMLGHWEVPLIYAAVENTAMADLMLRRKTRVSHMVQMRFGHSLGGGRIHPGFLTRLVKPLKTEAFITDRHFGGGDFPVPHFASLNAHEPVDLNTWAVARPRHSFPWSGYDPGKLFVRPKQEVVGEDEPMRACRQCRLGNLILRLHRQEAREGRLLPPCDPRVAVKHHHQHRITVRTMDGWSYQYHVNAGSVRVDRFCMGRDGRARYAAFHQLHGDENHRFGMGLQGNRTRSIKGYTSDGAIADPTEYDRIAAEAVQIMKNLSSIG